MFIKQNFKSQETYTMEDRDDADDQSCIIISNTLGKKNKLNFNTFQ